MKGQKKVGQFMSTTFNEQGGGERVMNSVFKAFNATLFTFKKNLNGKQYRQIGTETDARLTMRLLKD